MYAFEKNVVRQKKSLYNYLNNQKIKQFKQFSAYIAYITSYAYA